MTAVSPGVPAAPGRRLTIGLVTANIHLGVGATLWSRALDAAERHDVNLICFPGGEVGAADRPRNSVYDLVGPDVLDGLICWTSTLALPVAHARAARLARRFARLPMVSLNGSMGDDRPLTLDSYHGMCTAIGHLIEAHGRRRLAFIRGTVTNPVITERYRAYTDTLARARIPLDRALVSSPVDFHLEAGASAMRVLLDARGLRPGEDFDAVVACSDFLAADAQRVLAERGVRVPEDVAVIGVNDSPEARLADPPLTSVSMPFGELGELAVATLVSRLRGRPAPARPAPASRLVVRRSCGCPGTLLAHVADSPADSPADPPDPGEDRRAELLAAGLAEVATELARDGGIPVPSSDRLLAAFAEAVTDLGTDEAAAPAFLREVDRLVVTVPADAWDTALLALHRQAMRYLTGSARALADRLLGRARLVAAAAGRRVLEYERWQADQTSRRLRELGNALSSVVDLGALTEALDRALPGLGVPRWQLYLESAPPAGVLPTDRRYSMVAEPLHTRDELLGFGLFEVGPRVGAVYSALADQIGAAIKEIALFDEVRAARDLAEKANRVKSRLLSSVSDELRTPVRDIRRRADRALRAVQDLPDPPPRLVDTLKEIQVSTEHQLGVLADLLDLSKAESDTLDLAPELVDPGALLAEVFRRDRCRPAGRLPLIQADRRRLRQALVALRGSVARLSGGGPVAVQADVLLPHLRVRLRGRGGTADPDALDTVAALPITRRLLTLHNGTLRVDVGPGGVVAEVRLPLPCPQGQPGGEPADCMLAVGDGPALEAVEAARLTGLPLRRFHAGDDLSAIVADGPPAAVVWDLAGTRAGDWSVIRHLHDHPGLGHTPFLVYGAIGHREPGHDLDEAIAARRPAELAGPVLIVDPDPDGQAFFHRLVAQVRPGHLVLVAPDGTSALAALGQDVPSLVVVARTLPDMDGLDVLDRLHGAVRVPDLPALVLCRRTVAAEDARRAEPYGRAVLLGVGILTDAETAALLTRLLAPRGAAPQRGCVLVKHALAYLHQHYHHQITRRQVAKAAGMSEDYLSRMFHRELGISPWDYLNRLRIERAKERLRECDESIQVVARRVGFHDRAYFSRTFRRLTGMPPQAYRATSP